MKRTGPGDFDPGRYRPCFARARYRARRGWGKLSDLVIASVWSQLSGPDEPAYYTQIIRHGGALWNVPEGGALPPGCSLPVRAAYFMSGRPSTTSRVARGWYGTTYRRDGVDAPIFLDTRSAAERWLLRLEP